MQGRYMLAFPSAMDAVRFCHGLQLSLLFARWPNDLGHSGFEGAQEVGLMGASSSAGPVLPCPSTIPPSTGKHLPPPPPPTIVSALGHLLSGH